jgi:hypothetical protein
MVPNVSRKQGTSSRNYMQIQRNPSAMASHKILQPDMEDRIPMYFADDTSIFIAGNSANDIQRKMNKTIKKQQGGLKWID